MSNEISENTCFSQEGEDVLLERILHHINYKGSFVDIGAHHPIKYSNTYKFYCAGWRGINIEATPVSSRLFDEIRPFDINIEAPVSDKVEELTFFVFNQPELNTFSEEHALKWAKVRNIEIVNKIKLKTTTIGNILNKYYVDYKVFDLLSIDVEGLDLKILKTINFEHFIFNFIIVEDDETMSNVLNGEISEFLKSKGYILLSKLYLSSLYYFDYNSDFGKKYLTRIGISVNPDNFTKSAYVSRIIDSLRDIKILVPEHEMFTLVDQSEWGISGFFGGRRIFSFPDNDGIYWGPPENDESAILEIGNQFKNGSKFIFFAWPAFWWLRYYSGLSNYLNSNYKCVINNERIVGFYLHNFF